jgi:uncharacterized protein
LQHSFNRRIGSVMRSIPPEFDQSKLIQIDERLDAIKREHEVSIILAIESGSRAWGFPSPDSDYDCRFVFVRGPDDYLSPWQKRDVIEELTRDLDVSGWELGKTLKLMLKGNAVILEWLRSPIVYEGFQEIADELVELAERHSSRSAIARHYLHLGERQRRTYFADEKHVHLKKLFYALRPAAALRWMRLHPGNPIPPMHFPTLMRDCDPPPEVMASSNSLMERKAETRELGEAPLPPEIRDFVDAEFAIGRQWIPQRSKPLSSEAKGEAEALFRRAALTLAP